MRHSSGTPAAPDTCTDAQRVGFVRPDFAAPQHAIAMQRPSGIDRHQEIRI
jgi:hypothetical protein